MTDYELIAVPRPHVPHGPAGVPENEADAAYLRKAASNIEYAISRGKSPWGSNLSAVVIKLLKDAADAIEKDAARSTSPFPLTTAITFDSEEEFQKWLVDALRAQSTRIRHLFSDSLPEGVMLDAAAYIEKLPTP